MPVTGWRIGTPASIRESVPPDTVAIDEEPSELLRQGQHGSQRAFGKRAVAYLSALRAPWKPYLAYAKRWEVVMQHKLLVKAGYQPFDKLGVVDCPERDDA